MKVKIGNALYDAKDQPIMLVLDDTDKKHLKAMLQLPDRTKFCVYPAKSPESSIREWMEASPILFQWHES